MKKQRLSETLVMLGLLLGLAYLWFPHKSRQVLWTDKSLTAIYRPLQNAFSDSKAFFAGVNRRVSDVAELSAENAQLRQALRDLQMETLVLQIQVQNTRSGQVWPGFTAPKGREAFPVKILAQDLFLPSKSVFVDAGSEQSVALGDVVLAPSGLVGLVVKVLPDSSQVLLLTDPHFRVDAMSVKTKNRVLVSGVDADRLRGKSYPFLAQSQFLTGTQAFARGENLVTSGFGDVFPAGIPIGTVWSLTPRGSGSFVNAEIIPAVDFVKMNDLYVLRHFPSP